jgi:DNA-binding GntR family transcriptional regulator
MANLTAPTSTKNRVYAYVCSKIACGSLNPGDRLSHRALAMEIGVGYTPVREAIVQLAREGLVECHPRRGTFVSAISQKGLNDLFDLRLAIEMHAAARISGRARPSVLAKVRDLNQKLQQVVDELQHTGGRLWVSREAGLWLDVDKAIHTAILDETGNARAARTIQDVHRPCLNNMRYHVPTPASLQFSVDSHEGVFAAIERGESDRARDLTAKHIEHELAICAGAFGKAAWSKIDGHRADPLELPDLAPETVRSLEMAP